jgi:phosphonate transport system substrate-binding protein
LFKAEKMRVKILMLLLCACLGLGGCGDSEPVKKIDLSKREKSTVYGPAKAITYAYLPQYAHTVSYERHHLVVDYLSRTTGMAFRQVFPDTFDEHMHMVGRGLIDITFSNPFIYVKIADLYGARAFARIVEAKGKENFRGQIICRADNMQIKTLEDIKGKRLIAVDPTSAGGFLYPWGLILEHGIRKEDLAEIAFAPGPGGKQEKVVMAVLSGEYDVGLIREGTLDVMGQKGRIDLRQIRVLADSRWYPGWVYAARRGLDPAVVAKIKDALLALDMDNPEDATIFKRAGFIKVVAAKDEDFNPVRQLGEFVTGKKP